MSAKHKEKVVQLHKGGKKSPNDIVFDLNAKNGRIPWNADGAYPYKKKIGVVEY